MTWLVIPADLMYKDGRLYRKGREITTIHNTGYKVLTIKNQQYSVHRIVFLMHHGYLPEIVDHINGDQLDNHIENLRAADHTLNMINAKRRKDNKAGLKGLSWQEKNSRWRCYITHNGKSQDKTFRDLLDAAAWLIGRQNERMVTACRIAASRYS